MLLSLKTRSVPHGSRAVPNGGLGGCVVISPTHTGSEGVWDGSRDCHYGNKSTPSRLYDIRPTQRASNALRSRLDAPLPATPITPSHPRGPPVTIAYEDGAQEWPPVQTWPVDDGFKWDSDISPMGTSMSPTFKQPSMPVELPGSLLLPSQGFEQTNPPSTPPRLHKPFRVNDSESSFDTVPSLTNSCESSPESGSFSPSTLRSYLQKKLPALPAVDNLLQCESTRSPIEHTVTRTNTSRKSFTSMNARDLLLSSPNLHNEETAKQWMIAMERELSRLRDWTTEQAGQRTTSIAAMSLFFEELKGALSVARKICQTHDAAFRRVQESFDVNRRTHAVKLEQVEANIRDMLTRLRSKADIRAPIFRYEEVAVLLTFRSSIDVLSKFVQSQLVYQLRQQEHGLSQDLAGLLRRFDDNKHRLDRCQAPVDEAVSETMTMTTAAATTEWVQFEDLEVKLQRTQEMLQEAQKTLMFSHNELQNTSHNYDEAIMLVDRYQAKLNKYHNEADAIRNKLLAQVEVHPSRVTANNNYSQTQRFYSSYNNQSQTGVPRSRMTWDHNPPASTTRYPPPFSPTPTCASTRAPNTSRHSMGPKMSEIHTGIDDLIRRLQSQTNQITSLSDQVAHLRDDNAVLNRQNTSLSQEIYHAQLAAFGGEAGDKRRHDGAAHLADVTGKAKGRMRQLKLKLHCGIRRTL